MITGTSQALTMVPADGMFTSAVKLRTKFSLDLSLWGEADVCWREQSGLSHGWIQARTSLRDLQQDYEHVGQGRMEEKILSRRTRPYFSLLVVWKHWGIREHGAVEGRPSLRRR